MDSKIEIKVTNPKREDNKKEVKPASEPDDQRRRRKQEQRQQAGNFVDSMSFKNWVPWMIPGFVLVNVILFTISMYINNCPKNSSHCLGSWLGRFSFQPFKENPLIGPSSSTLEKMGALEVSRVVKHREAWRMITCIWLHAGVFHILANMLSLLFIGIRLEREFGFMRIGLLYIIAGFGGSLMSSLFIQSRISVGASGALFGLLGSMLSELIINWTTYANKFSALITLVLVIIINLAMGILPFVDNFAHIGGFLSGFLLGFVLLIRPQFGYVSKRKVPPGVIARSNKPRHKTYQYVLWVISLILLIAGFAVGMVLLLEGVNLNNHCRWCQYMSCVPTPLWSCKTGQVYCQLSEFEYSMNLTCISNGKSEIYQLTKDITSEVQQLCSKLCS